MQRLLASATAAGIAIALLGGACSTSDGSAPAPTTARPPAEPMDFSGRGPFAVGQVDLHLDADHVVVVFYPVDPDAVPDDAEPYAYDGTDVLAPQISAILPGSLSGEVAPDDTWVGLPASDAGPFPTVLHSHGFSGNARFGNQHNAAVASWGYVVAAVDHPERGLKAILDGFLGGGDAERPDEYLDSDQLVGALDLLEDTNADAASPLSGAVDADRVAAEGHSAGGSAAGTAAYDPRVDLWIGQAPGTPLEPGTDLAAFIEPGEGGERGRFDTGALLAATTPPEVSSLIIAAEGDTVIPLDRVEPIFDWLAAPKRFAVIAGSGHAVFVDPCVPI
ncbi:MAG: hypothetical protein Q8K72_03770, partial [Acidimicrobiales bacterium]|nr:hypothetical protein [Acidimicrobiales bacterium]